MLHLNANFLSILDIWGGGWGRGVTCHFPFGTRGIARLIRQETKKYIVGEFIAIM